MILEMEERLARVKVELPVLDGDFFSELTAGDEDFQRMLLQAFIESAPAYITGLHIAVDTYNLADVVYQAHTLKGSCKAIGAASTAQAAADIEAEARKDAPGRFGELIKKLDDCADQLLRHIDEILNS